MKQVRVLDDVLITKDKTIRASENYAYQLQEFNEGLENIEKSYRNDLQAIDSIYNVKEGHASALEKEMSVALSELQVSDDTK